METVNEYAYGASFRLFDMDGLNVLFTVRAEDGAAHLSALDVYLAALKAAGYTVNLPGTEPGEQVEEVNAWVLGETSRDEPCVYLYSSNTGLKWRIATVYVEDMPDLPFVVMGKRWPGAAPEREMAQKKGVLHEVEPFKIVLKPTGKMTDGDNPRPVLKFDRVLDARPAAPASPQPPAGNGNHTDFNDLEPALFPVGTHVLVAGKNDEKPGTVTDVGNGDLRLVRVDGREITVSTSRLKLAPGPEQAEMSLFEEEALNGAYAES